MIYWLFSLFVSSSLFAQSVTSTSATPNGSISHYHITPKHRALDIINLFNTFNGNPYNLTKRYRIALQTTRNSLINWVQSISPASNYTLFIVGYGSDTQPQYVVLPVEQITELIYSIGNISGGFNAMATSGVLPIFEINSLDRANDIIQVVNTLLTNYRSFNGTPDVQVALQTSLT
ncbi:MAG TPA: hypothetical protein VHL30_00385, partial [Chlamydiales bacterium]|nr:hypothetical protein [Chlamydiales bacterium]